MRKPEHVSHIKTIYYIDLVSVNCTSAVAGIVVTLCQIRLWCKFVAICCLLNISVLQKSLQAGPIPHCPHRPPVLTLNRNLNLINCNGLSMYAISIPVKPGVKSPIKGKRRLYILPEISRAQTQRRRERSTRGSCLIFIQTLRVDM